MDPAMGWLVLALFWGLPLAHVALAPTAGPWSTPPEARCPFSPRVGWLVIVLLLGPVGWLLFAFRKRRR